MRGDSLRTARWLALLIPAALLAGAWGSQLIGGLVPCEMCLWQRQPHYAALPLALIALLVPQRGLQITFVLLAALAIAISGAIGVSHAGVEYHWWPGFTPCTAVAAHGNGMDMLTEMLKRPIIRCDVPQWSLFGISLAGFNAIFSLTGAVTILILALRGLRR